ncbi:preprotein translocase subunit YajC [Frigoribacterium sp. VKM Ac-1396]|jgi:preprotein translocase subunit YajC|uniref:preprotein translocase subunit YajC n=1 Tax=Frigoribacterium sp. VKM Ac-1396 TaxID=2783821 RepID=UPI00188BAE21|nr:preprotein translocase subunit YajC [Frigoribacterium sp. VKM Ac-1396]MBF4599588.1 preprotein translocase subunit YajC [Frigoribacterium sp. VKM Ac-1396]
MDPATLIMVLLLVVLVVFMFRNKKKRDRQQAELQNKLVPGVEVMLSFGVYGTVVSIDDENNVAEVEVSPGTVLKVHRQTLGRVVDPVIDEPVADDAESSIDGTPGHDRVIGDAPEFGERSTTSPVDSTVAKDSDNKA